MVPGRIFKGKSLAKERVGRVSGRWVKLRDEATLHESGREIRVLRLDPSLSNPKDSLDGNRMCNQLHNLQVLLPGPSTVVL